MRRLVVALCLLGLCLTLAPTASASSCQWGVQLGGKCTGFTGRPLCGEGDILVNDAWAASYRWAICLPP